MDRMSQYTTQGERKKKSCRWKTRTKRKLTSHYKQKDSKTNVKK
jgi:hypothetical protein